MSRPTLSDGRERMPRLLTLQAAAVDSGIPVSSLRDLIHRGHLPSVQLPGSRRVFVVAADVATLIARSVHVRRD